MPLRYLTFLFLLILSNKPIAQTNQIRLLKQNITKANTTEQKLQTLFSLCDLGYSLHPDTLMFYAKQAEAIAKQTKNKLAEVRSQYFQSYAFTNKGLIDSSLELANNCLEQLKTLNDPVLKANVLNQKGRCFMRKNNYKEAMDMGYQVIEVAEKAKDTLLQMKGKTLIGWAYLEMGQTRESLSWHLKAWHTTNDTLLIEQYGVLFGNLALNYNALGQTDSALYCINKAIQYSRKYENLFALSNALAIQAQLFVRAGKPQLAEAPLKEVVEIRKVIGDPFYIVSDMSQLGLYYAHNGQSDKGIAICNEGIAIARAFKLDTKLFFLYGTLAENYKAAGNTTKYAETLEQIIELKDSVYATNSAEALAEMQTKYELAKKENVIILQKLDISRKNTVFYSLVAFFLLALAGGFLWFREYKKSQKLKIIKAEENERKRIAADLHDNMGAYTSAIIANIDDIIDNKKNNDDKTLNLLKMNAGEIMNTLRETIWALSKEKIPLTGICDRFKIYTQKISHAYPQVKVVFNENISNDILFSSVQALNIFRILQEAFTNSLKHSGADTVRIKISSNEKLMISVQDNGIGIKDQNLVKKGNGITNMQSRAEESGMRIKVKQGEQSGTTVVLTDH